MLMAMEEIRAFLVLSFARNSTELCAELHFLTSNFLSSMLLFRYDHFLTRNYCRFTKRFKSVIKLNCCLPMEALTKKGRLASVEKNCRLLKVLPNRLHLIPQKKTLQYPWFGHFTVQCKQSCSKSVACHSDVTNSHHVGTGDASQFPIQSLYYP